MDNERVMFDHHDWSIGHVTLRRGEVEGVPYLFLQIGSRDLQFREDGTCVGAGTSLVGVYNDCAKCVEGTDDVCR